MRCWQPHWVSLGVSLTWPITACAETETPGDGIEPEAHERFAARGIEPPADEHDLQRLSRNWQHWHSRSAEAGLHWELGYTAEALANVAGGLGVGATAAGLAEIEVRLEPQRWGAWPGLSAQVSAIYPHGASLSSEFTGDLFGVSNIDAYDVARLYEVWVQQSFFGDRLSLRAGQLGAESDFLSTVGGDGLINGTFGWPAFMAANCPAPGFPLTVPGVRLAWNVTDSVWLHVAAYDGDPDPRDGEGNSANPHGVRFHLGEGTLMLAEAGWRRHSNPKPDALDCRLRVGGWYHSGRFPDLARGDDGAWLTEGQSAPMHTGNWGLYSILEQQLWEPRSTDAGSSGAWFARLGGAPADRNQIQGYAEAGLHMHGLIPGRGSDVTSLGVAWARLSPDLRGWVAEQSRLSKRDDALPDFEFVLELTHRIQLLPGWTLQPDFQWIIHPGGSGATPNAVVVGLRTAWVF